MKARSIFCIAILVAVVFEECSSLGGGEDAVCWEFSHPPGSLASTFSEYYDDDYDKVYEEYYSDELTSPPKSIPSHEPTIIEKCCEGYVNNSGICEPQCEPGCENGHCLRPGECACNDDYEEILWNTCSPICDRDCINGYCTSPNQCSCNVGYGLSADGFTCEPICSQPCEFGASCTAPESCTCDNGFVRYEAEHGSCVPDCKTSCNQGICTARGCACAFGWVGESCDEPLFCTVTQPADVSVVNEQDSSTEPTMIEITDKNYQSKWNGPTCHKRCLDQLNTTAVDLIRTNGIMTQYLVPVDSLCNVIEKSPEPSRWSSSVMWRVIGIASIVVVFVIGVIFMRMRQRTRIMQ